MTGPLLPERIEELIAGYVLGNLSSEEAEEFNQLLLEHPELASEVHQLQDVLEVLPYALPEVEPPQHLRQAILDTTLVSGSATLSNPNPQFWNRLKGSPLFWGRVIGSVAVFVVLVLGLDNYRIRLQVTTMKEKVARQKDVISMLQKPDTHVVPLKGMSQASAATGSMLMTPSESNAVLILQNLPVLPQGQFYQLWSVKNEEKIPWGQFRTSKHGTVFVKLSRPSDFEVTSLVITVEVSPAPTTPAGPMVMAGNLSINNQ
ncbi:MAG: anti-sigma factor [Coleofasciculaceae cyanobacterium]